MMKLKFTCLAVVVALAGAVQAQETGYRATVDEDGRLTVMPAAVPTYETSGERGTNQLDGFPLGHLANPTFKNQRGATLADIDNDGRNEIIFGADSMLYAYEANGDLLWSRVVSGFIVLPPAIKDMDGDGSMEIALNTGGFPPVLPPGRVYLMDADGNDLDGWPKNFDDHWMISAPAIADIDGDGVDEVITSERIGATGNIHVLRMDGTELNENWPVEIPNTPGFTPSAGDIDGDGYADVVSGSSTNGELHVFDQNGEYLPGFPQIPDSGGFSYQSPLILDLDGDGSLDIVGARHGNGPEYYAVGSDGNYLPGWPIALPGWTYAPPSAADTDHDGSYEVFMGHPQTETDGDGNFVPTEVIHGFEADGNYVEHFPISKIGGNESVITIADINNDGVPDLIFTSNLIGTDGYGFIHAYSTDGSGELDGFPLRPRGWTFLQSALLDDLDQDGNLDLVALTYTATFGAGVDSIYVSAFDLGLPYIPENIHFNAYKGDNTRAGLMAAAPVGLANQPQTFPLEVYPNPTNGTGTVRVPEKVGPNATLDIHDAAGKKVHSQRVGTYATELSVPTESFESGVYLIRLTTESATYVNKLVVE